MSVSAKHSPEDNGTGFPFEIRNREILGPLHDFWVIAANLAHAGEIPFHVRHENGNATRAKAFRERLQRDRLAGAGRPGDEAVAIRHFRQEKNRFGALRHEDRLVHKRAASLSEDVLGVQPRRVACSALAAALSGREKRTATERRCYSVPKRSVVSPGNGGAGTSAFPNRFWK